MFPMFGGGNAKYTIPRSLRFNSADSAYLSRTPSVSGNRKTWTFSAWVKRSTLGTSQALLSGTVGNTTAGTDEGTVIKFAATTDCLEVYDYTNSAYNFRLVTTQTFRDPSAWYHVVVVLDTTQTTASNRVKVYVNGSRITSFSVATYPNQNTEWNINNSAAVQAVGANRSETTLQDYFNGYLTEINLVDGAALDANHFGEIDADTGAWRAKKYSVKVPVQYLIVAGGGGGGGDNGGGAGAGGLLYGVVDIQDSTVVKLTVGAGGGGGGINGAGNSGGNSTFSVLQALGGGGGAGGDLSTPPKNGGSGGGGNGETPTRGAFGTVSQGNDGGNGYAGGGGGGGGAGGAGTTATQNSRPGTGGVGLAYSITGSEVYYAGGGGGGSDNGVAIESGYALGGTGGGGKGFLGAVPSDGHGTAGTGGGGGGCGFNGDYGHVGGNGGSGVVVLSYPATFTATFSAGVTQTTTTTGSKKVTTITAAGPTDTVTFA